MAFEVIASSRSAQGTGASRRLRKEGKLPGIVYGAGKDPVVIEMNHNDMYYALQEEAFHASILNLKIDNTSELALVRSVQYHPFKQQVLHVDFQRVNSNEKIHIKVPFHFVNAESAPGVKLGGGTVSHVTTEADVSCLPASLPEYIEVDLGNLNAGQSIHLSDIKLPEGVEFVALGRGENQTVAAVIGAKGGSEE